MRRGSGVQHYDNQDEAIWNDLKPCGERFTQQCYQPEHLPTMKSILSGVLRGKNAADRCENRVGALRIEFIELSRDESMGIECLFGR